jgi:hypothetical protein
MMQGRETYEVWSSDGRGIRDCVVSHDQDVVESVFPSRKSASPRQEKEGDSKTYTSANPLKSLAALPVESTHTLEEVSAAMSLSEPILARRAVRKVRKLVRSLVVSNCVEEEGQRLWRRKGNGGRG